VDSVITGGHLSSFTLTSSTDDNADDSVDNTASHPSTTSINSINHTVISHSADALDRHSVDGLQAIAENPRVIGAGDSGSGDGMLEVCVESPKVIGAGYGGSGDGMLEVCAESPRVIGAGDGGSGDGILEVCDSQTSEVHSRCVADQQNDQEEHFSTDQPTDDADDDDDDDDDDESTTIKYSDDDKTAVIISASSSLSSFTITPYSSVTIDDTSVDLLPYPVAASPALHTGFESNVLATSTDSCSTQSHRPVDETWPVSLKAAGMSAVSHPVDALNLPLLSTESAKQHLDPTVVGDGRNSSEHIPQHEEEVWSDSNLDSLPNFKDEQPDDSRRQLTENSGITLDDARRQINEDSEVNSTNSPTSHIPPESAAANDFFNAESFLTSRVTHVAVGGDIWQQAGTNIIDGQSVNRGSADHISLVADKAPVTSCQSLPLSGVSEATAVVDEWSGVSCDAAVKVRDTTHTTHSLSTSQFPPPSAMMNADIKTFVSPPGKQAVLSTDQCAVNANDTSDKSSRRKSYEAAGASQPKVQNDLIALQQVSITCVFLTHLHM